MGEFMHKPCHLVSIAISWVCFVVVIFFNVMAGTGSGLRIGIFLNNTRGISNKYYTCITPVGWTFTIWAVIYIWSLIWLVYGLTTICRKGADGYLYYSPNIMPFSLYLVFGFNNLLNTGWIFLWDREYMIVALVFLIFIVITLYICLAISFVAVKRAYTPAIQFGLVKELWMVRVFVQNGLGVYATWTTIATLVNLTIVLIYKTKVKDDIACTIALALLAAFLLLWFALDMFALDNYVRYFLSPYVAVLFSLAGSLVGNYHPWTRNTIFSVVLIGVGGVFLVVKIIVMAVRIRIKSLGQISFEPTTEKQSVNGNTPTYGNTPL